MIEVVDSNNLEEILPLIREYQEFYEIPDISDINNREFFPCFARVAQKVVSSCFDLMVRCVVSQLCILVILLL